MTVSGNRGGPLPIGGGSAHEPSATGDTASANSQQSSAATRRATLKRPPSLASIPEAGTSGSEAGKSARPPFVRQKTLSSSGDYLDSPRSPTPTSPAPGGSASAGFGRLASLAPRQNSVTQSTNARENWKRIGARVREGLSQSASPTSPDAAGRRSSSPISPKSASDVVAAMQEHRGARRAERAGSILTNVTGGQMSLDGMMELRSLAQSGNVADPKHAAALKAAAEELSEHMAQSMFGITPAQIKEARDAPFGQKTLSDPGVRAAQAAVALDGILMDFAKAPEHELVDTKAMAAQGHDVRMEVELHAVSIIAQFGKSKGEAVVRLGDFAAVRGEGVKMLNVLSGMHDSQQQAIFAALEHHDRSGKVSDTPADLKALDVLVDKYNAQLPAGEKKITREEVFQELTGKDVRARDRAILNISGHASTFERWSPFVNRAYEAGIVAAQAKVELNIPLLPPEKAFNAFMEKHFPSADAKDAFIQSMVNTSLKGETIDARVTQVADAMRAQLPPGASVDHAAAMQAAPFMLMLATLHQVPAERADKHNLDQFKAMFGEALQHRQHAEIFLPFVRHYVDAKGNVELDATYTQKEVKRENTTAKLASVGFSFQVEGSRSGPEPMQVLSKPMRRSSTVRRRMSFSEAKSLPGGAKFDKKVCGDEVTRLLTDSRYTLAMQWNSSSGRLDLSANPH